ncbi:MAG: Nif3-like dinuclear metal center hexameric protein [Mycoplasma sp.]|nr:Nif3-like dinuclear metal center hexameric protein [Mycoplasma sp.]
MIKQNLNVKNVISIIEDLFPLNLAESWDKVGLQIGEKKKKVENIVVALDLTTDVMDFAIDKKADLIITYHPFLFEETSIKTGKTNFEYKNKIIDRLKKFNIAVYCIHTSFDKEPRGMSLAIKHNFKKELKTWKIKGLNSGIIVNWNDTIYELTETFKNDFNINFFATNSDSQVKKIKNFALINGSIPFGDINIAWKNNDIDLVVVSDIKWSNKIALREEKITFLEISHLIEKVFINHLSKFLIKNLEKINIFQSKAVEIVKNNF